MAEKDDLQERFDGGILSPRLSGRFSSELYRKALADCVNFDILPQGSIRRRAGSATQFPLVGDRRTRGIGFRTSTGESFLFEFLDRKINVYQIDETTATAQKSDTTAVPSLIGQSELILNGGFNTPDGDKWQWTALKAAGIVSLSVMDANGNPAGLPGRPPFISFIKLNADHQIVLPAVQLGYAALSSSGDPTPPNVNRFASVMYQRIQTPFDNTSIRLKMAAAISFGHNDCIRVKISTTEPKAWAGYAAGGEVYSRLYGSLAGEAIRGLGVGDGAPNPPAFSQIDLGDINIPVAGFYYISFQLERSDDHAPSDPGFDSYLQIDNVSSIATYTIPGTTGGAAASIPTPWTANEVNDLQFVPETARDRLIFVHGDHAPWFLLYGGLPGNWQFGAITFAPAIPTGWGDAGSANVGVGWTWLGSPAKLAKANWPSSVDFHDGRVYYGGEKAQANRIVASTPGKSDDFTFGPDPGNALDFKLSTKGRIQWVASNRSIMVGTDVGEHSVTGSKGTPLVGDTQARQEYADMSAPIQGVSIGTYVVYVSSDLRRVHAASFDFASSGWDVKDLNFSSEHLTESFIRKVHFATTPDKTIVAELKDGTLILCAFDPVEQVLAWWRVDVGGFICSVAITQGTLGAYAWLFIDRGGTIYLEKLQLSESGEFIRYLDASSFVTADINGLVSGLERFAGQKVNCVALDGRILGTINVAANGTAILPPEFGVAANGTIYAGLDYTARAVTMPRNLRFGKAQTGLIGAVLNKSGLPRLNGKLAKKIKETKATALDTIYTGKVRAGNLGWDDEGVVTIEQDQPIRTEVCALFTKVDAEDT